MAKEDRKLKILNAASECFARYGFEKTTLDDIGKIVGLNKASLYYYYVNKENIFCDVIFREADIYIEEIQKKVRSARSAEAKILSYLGERLNYYRLVVNLHNLSMDTIRKVEPVFSEIYDKILAKEAAFLSQLIKEGVDDGEFTKTDSQKLAEILLTVATSIRYREVHISYVRMAGEADYVKITDEVKLIAKMILKGIKA
ncbi:hypothetical protein BH11BAC2_BH11BAC2_10040 [soil metagenome]